MRAALLTLILVLGTSSVKSQSLPEWYRVHTFDDSIIELNTFVVTAISDDVSRVRFRWTFDQQQSLPNSPDIKYRSRIEVMEFNCTAKMYRSFHTTFLESGAIVRTEDSPSEWRKLGSGIMIEKLFVPGCELIRKKKQTPPVPDERASVARYAHDFAQYVEKKKDLKTAIDKFFVADYLTRYVQDSRKPWFFNLSREIAAKTSQSELERFYVAMMNAAYLSSVYLIGQLPSDLESTTTPEPTLPPDVLLLLRNHPYMIKYKRGSDYYFLGDKIESSDQLQSYTDLLEKIASLMRKHIGVAESSQQYKAMLEEWDLYNPERRVCDDCLGLPRGTEVFEVNVPVFHLQVARFGGQLKVISAKTSF